MESNRKWPAEVSLGPMGATATFQHCADQAMQLEEQGYKVNPIILLFARRADDEEEILQTWSSGEAAEMLERLSEFVEDNTDSPVSDCPVSYDDEVARGLCPKCEAREIEIHRLRSALHTQAHRLDAVLRVIENLPGFVLDNLAAKIEAAMENADKEEP